METAHCVPILVAVRYALPYTDRTFTCSRLRYTRSVGITPLLFGCSAPQRVQRHTTGTANHNRHTATQHSNGTARNQAPTATQHSNGSSGPQRSATHHHNRHNTSRNTPDPSALHPFCSGAALRNGCSATQRMQRHATDAFRATCAPRDGEYATMTTPKHSMSGAGAIASDLSISPGILSTGTRPTGDRGIVPAAAQHPVHRHATNRCYLERLLPHSKLVSQCHNHPSVTRPSGTTRLHPAVAASST